MFFEALSLQDLWGPQRHIEVHEAPTHLSGQALKLCFGHTFRTNLARWSVVFCALLKLYTKFAFIFGNESIILA